MKKKAMWIIILVVAIVVAVGAGAYAITQQRAKAAQEAEYQKLREEVEMVDQLLEAEYGERDGEAPENPDVLIDGAIPIDFDKLQNINSDLIGWIRVPNTNIDYPIARYEGEDQTYYLTHNMYKEAQFAGCIYMQDCNSSDFSDYNTVLYGHNMKNKSMFANLHLFEDEAFFDENNLMYVYVPGHAYVYEIFAAYRTDNTNLNYAFDFKNQDMYNAYVTSVLNTHENDSNHIREGIEISEDQKMVTLSTCVAGNHKYRYVVQGVLVEDVESNE